LSFGNYTPYPYSRGSIHITGPTIRDELDFETGFLSDDLDVAALVWAYKKHREVMRRTKMYRGELRIRHPTFPPGSKAACVDLSLADDNDNAVSMKT
jgi:alcohol oxidase